MSARIAVLWHLHQPEYRDPTTGVPVMPWTRLHALRGYRDLLIETAETGVRWTLNIVPGLWEQILYYAEGGRDRHLDLTAVAADALTATERREIVATFPCGHPTMRDTPRYRAIEDAIAAGRDLDEREIRDLQVLSTLVWAGATARRDHPSLRALHAKGAGFDEADKLELLRVQAAILAEFPALLQRVVERGGCVSTTPLRHPILPLLVDVSHAARSLPVAPDAPFAWPDDARLQLVRGRAAMAAWTGRAPAGCWPSEGAVSPEVVPLIAEAGFRWLCTDDGVLHRSDGERLRPGSGGWDLGHGVVGFFRDHGLSDRIGFDYARWPADAAVHDFFARADAAGPGIRVVALDGENPWEAWPDAGEAFRRGLIAGLADRGITLDAAAELPVVGRIDRLHTGSWIGADLRIWAGAEEDRRAWALLAELRAAVEQATVGRDAAMEHVLAAEGSDWFWWYGPEFTTPFSAAFDEAFRGLLAAGWRAIGQVPPASLDVPIARITARARGPERPLSPESGGRGAWLGAGVWELPQGSMARGHGREVRYGWDARGALWLGLPDGVSSLRVDGVSLPVRSVVSIPACHQATIEVDGAVLDVVGRDWVV